VSSRPWLGSALAAVLAVGALVVIGCQRDRRAPVGPGATPAAIAPSAGGRPRVPVAAVAAADGASRAVSALEPLLRRIQARCRYTPAGALLPRGCTPPTLEGELVALERQATPWQVVGAYAALWSAAGPVLASLALARLEGLAQERAWAQRAAEPAALAALNDWLVAHRRPVAFGQRVAQVLGLLAGTRGAEREVLGRLAARAPAWAVATVEGALWTHGRGSLLPRLIAAVQQREDPALRIAVLRGLAGGPPWGADERAQLCPLLDRLLVSEEPLAVAAEAGFRAASECPEALGALLAAGRRWLSRGEIEERLIGALSVAASRPRGSRAPELTRQLVGLLEQMVRRRELGEASRAAALAALYGVDARQARRAARAQATSGEGLLARAVAQVLAAPEAGASARAGRAQAPVAKKSSGE